MNTEMPVVVSALPMSVIIHRVRSTGPWPRFWCWFFSMLRHWSGAFISCEVSRWQVKL
jgi:hypothetical protein